MSECAAHQQGWLPNDVEMIKATANNTYEGRIKEEEGRVIIILG